MRSDCLCREITSIRLESFLPLPLQMILFQNKFDFNGLESPINFREAVVRWSFDRMARGKSGHLRAGFPVKTGGACVKASSRQVQQKTYHLPPKARLKRWGKSPPLPRQLGRQCKPNPMQDEIGNQVARLMVSGTSHPPLEESMRSLIDKWMTVRIEYRSDNRIWLTASRNSV